MSVTEFERMRALQGESMADECALGAVTVDTTSPEPSESFAYGSAIACGYEPDIPGQSSTTEAGDGSEAASDFGKIRVPLTASVTNTTRVKLTKRSGTTLGTPEYFRVLGFPARGRTCFVLSVQRIAGEASQ